MYNGQKRKGRWHMDKISVAVPCYNEEPTLEPFFAAVSAVAEQMPEVAFEFLFIDDGSRDRTLEKMQELARRDMDAEQLPQSDTEELARRIDEYYEEFEKNGIDNVKVEP